MNEPISPFNRVPIGLVVEGDGEYHSFPSLVSRILGISHLNIPRVNAGGCGGIYKHLGKQISALVQTHHPREVIVTVDLIDAIEQKIFSSCEELRISLDNQIEKWYQEAQNDQRMSPLPHRITGVIQIQKFETWLIADVSGLIAVGHINENAVQVDNVDNNVPNPDKWLGKHKKSNQSIKNPRYAKQLITALDPNIMISHSRSFHKFFREVQGSYKKWCAECGI